MAGDNKQIILIVDDQKINREILKNILSREYDTREAANGQEALDILERDKGRINAVLLDVMMPVMDGYGFMNHIRGTKHEGIPVIVLTGSTGEEAESRALNMGAWDFISKPYQPAILISRLKNAIARSQLGAYEQIKHTAEHDLLTGLYNRTKFFENTQSLIEDHPETEFAMIRLDIDHFNLLNSFWGEKGGDMLLKYMGNSLERACDIFPFSAYGRIMADVFCVCVPNDSEKINSFIEQTKKEIMSYNVDFFIKPTYGIYAVEERENSAESMYECASVASKACKGKYNVFIGYYDRSMHEAYFREQEIINDMQNALDEGQFKPFFQPKYSLKTNRACGAEALVRWIKPQKEIISPNVFIPIFERNGFIGKLDYYMWDAVCTLLRKWLDEGLDPAPVSVNISRANMYNPNIVSNLTSLVRAHNIPTKLLNLELTESAYMDNPEIMKRVIRELQEKGFVVMMDDFGSGYSSLNTLKDIPVDILKIDMKFLAGDDKTVRSERILSSIIRMAGWLSLPVIVEGVETSRQTDFLRSIGCGYVQGYYFARPMPVEEYEKIVREKKKGEIVREEENISPVNEAVWTSNPYVEFLSDQIQQPLGVVEITENECFPLRVNEAYNRIFGYGRNIFEVEDLMEKKSSLHDRGKIRKITDGISDRNRTADFIFATLDGNGKKISVRMIINYLGKISDGKVLLFLAEKEMPDMKL